MLNKYSQQNVCAFVHMTLSALGTSLPKQYFVSKCNTYSKMGYKGFDHITNDVQSFSS